MTPLRRISRAVAIGASTLVVAHAAGTPQERQVVRIETITTAGGGPQAQGQVPQSSVQQNGTGLIVGQVIDAGGDRGVAGAIVTLGGALPGAPVQGQQFQATTMAFSSRDGSPPVLINNGPNSSLPRLITDAEGRFAFRNLPKGVFNITATKPGFLDGAYGRLRPNGPIQTIELAEDERSGELKVRLFRSAAISGTVLDDLSEPVVGIQVRAYRRSLVAGKRLLTAAAGTATTDDRGVYRLANLIPGEYVVALQTLQSSVPASMQLDGPLALDLLSTMPIGNSSISLSNSGTSVTSDGRFRLQSNNGFSAPGPSGRTLVYPTQYYPSANSVSQAAPILVASGEDRSGIDLHLKLVPTINVSGRLMGPDGPAANFALHLVPSDTGDLSNDPDVATTITDTNGEFQFLAVPAGQYVIQTVRASRGAAGERVAINAGGGAAASYTVTMTATAAGAAQGFFTSAAATSGPAVWLAMPITLTDSDVNDVLLSLRTGLKVTGRVEFDGTAERPPADRLATISVIVESADGKQKTQVPQARIDGNGQFTVQGLLPGKYVMRVNNAPGGWTFKGASNGGADITDAPFEVEDRDVTGVTVTFFDRPSELRGTVRSAAGAADASAAVVVFPADTRSWMNYGVNPRRMRMARTSKTGMFTFGALPAGDYFLVAMSDEAAGEWQDPQFLDQLSRSATRVTIGEGQKSSQDLATQNVRPGGGFVPAPNDDVEPGHGPFVADATDDQAQTQTQTQTQSRDTRPQPQAPSRDTAATPTGTASLTGLVTLEDAGQQPVRRARVTARSSDGRTERLGATDDSGRFAVTGLPPGHYTLMISKASYLPAYYGSKRPGRGPGVPIALAAGQALNNLSIKMAKGGVVSGIVRDEFGLPVASATIRLMQFRTVNGERTLTNQQSAVTDDRGVYRAFGLTPATYIVSAMPPATISQNEIRQLSNADLQTALSDLQRQAQPGAASPNASTGPAGGGSQPASRPVGRTVGFAPVYFPGTLVPAEAATIAVAAGQEVPGIDIPVRLVATARVEGTVFGVDGRPASGVALNLVSADLGQAVVITPKISNTNPEGKFSFSNVAPGHYALSARGGAGNAVRFAGGDFVMAVPALPAGGGALPPLPPPPPPPPPIGLSPPYASADVDVNGENVTDLVLTLQDAMTVSGTVVFAGRSLTPPANLGRTRISLQPMGSNVMMLGVPDATIDATGAFKITGIAPGRYRLSASVPGGGPAGGGAGAAAGWALRSAIINGRDILDTPFEIRAGQNAQNMVVTFTDQPTEISGMLMDGAGKPMPGFSIVVFSTDRATWSAGSRRISPPIQVSSDGKYKATGLPPGEYFLAALTDYEPGDLGDASFLEQVAAVSIKVTLGEGEKKVQDLKVAGSTPRP